MSADQTRCLIWEPAYNNFYKKYWTLRRRDIKANDILGNSALWQSAMEEIN